MGSEQDLSALLQQAEREVHFKVHGQPESYSSQTVRAWFRQKSDSGQYFFGLARPVLREDLRTEIEDSLRGLFQRHLNGDEVGNGFSRFLGGIGSFSLEMFTTDIVKAAVVLGPDRASQVLHQWEQGEPVNYRWHLILTGISVEDPIDTGDGIKIMELPRDSSEVSRHLPPFSSMPYADGSFTSAPMMTIDCHARPAFHSNSDIRSPIEGAVWGSALGPMDYVLIRIFCQALSLATNQAVYYRIAWRECDLARAFSFDGGSGGMWPSALPVPREKVPLSNVHLEEARRIYTGRLAAEDIPEKLESAIDRWIRSKRTYGDADKLRELRTALENLYSIDDTRELGFRLSVHGAWHLGQDPAERADIARTLRDVYGVASTATHSGSVKSKRWKPELLPQAQDLCRRGILKMLDEGVPDADRWNNMIMGGE